MDKCKWKDGFLHICDDRADEVRKNITLAEEFFPFCKWCGADIRISEEKPLIVKSGGTWVMELDGKNYLCVFLSRYETTDPLDMEEQKSEIIIKGIGVGCWKSFSEIELTDEIAKLRPYVLDKSESIIKPCILVYMQGDINAIVIGSSEKWTDVRKYYLATPHELETE